MDSQEKREREVLELILANAADEATDDQRKRLSHLIASDSALALFAVQALHQEAWLARRLLQEPLEDPLSRIAHDQTMTLSHEARPNELATRSESRQELPVRCVQSRPSPITFGRLATAVLLLLMVGAIGGGGATWWAFQRGTGGADLADANHRNAPSQAPQTPIYLAKFVQGTGCVWEPGSLPPRMGDSNLRGGECFNLMEGLAEIELSLPAKGIAALTLEGPARMILRAEGIPNLTQGKFTMRVPRHVGPVTLETPTGRIIVSEDSSLGVAVRGLEVAVHVFRGDATVACPWLPESAPSDTLHVRSNESVRLYVDGEKTNVEQATARPELFAAQTTTMGEDRLRVTSAYVNEITQASPILYWRFEEIQQGMVKNVVGDRYHGLVYGAPALAKQGENQVVEFGSGLPEEAKHGFVEASDPLGDEITDSYSVEFWVKPSHYHLGSLVSVYSPANPGHHGALIELGGTPSAPSIIEHAGQLRFLHRDPPAEDRSKGTSCFSTKHYKLRQWMHVVAVKGKSEMRLYVNGRLAATSEDNTNLAPGLTMTIGQLDEHRHNRAFIGQMDELAIYNRALSAGEIQTHYSLVRPPKAALLPSSI